MKLLFIFLVLQIIIYPQINECGFSDPENIPESSYNYEVNILNQRGGLLAPAKTLNGSYIKILFIFAQFEGDNKLPNDSNWPINQLPIWSGKFVGKNISEKPFEQNTISNYFYEMSNGQNIIIGETYPSLVMIPGDINSAASSNKAVLQKVDQDYNFKNLDNWNMNRQEYNVQDNYVDAICIIWRNVANTWGGLGAIELSSEFTTNELVKISSRVPTISFTINAGNKNQYIFPLPLMAHEYGHYLFGAYHNFENSLYSFMQRGTINRGLGLMNSGSGGGLAMNPHEKYLLGYINYTNISYDQAGLLPDFNTTGTAIQFSIPLHTLDNILNNQPDEFFVLVNHQKKSIYERIEKKGLYLYHVKTNNYGHNHMRMISADGLWDWKITSWVPKPSGYGAPNDYFYVTRDPLGPVNFPIIQQQKVNRSNGRNEMQEVVYAKYNNVGPEIWWDRWLNENGKPNPQISAEFMEPFRLNYNELFNPWSNPATYGINGYMVKLGFRILNENNGVFSMQFCFSEHALNNMPPSKPQNLTITKNTNDNSAILRWEANIESNMNGGIYQIFRASDINNYNYVYLATVNFNPIYDPLLRVKYMTWNDPSVYISPGVNKLVYKIKAIDVNSLQSVFSDSACIEYNFQAQKSNLSAANNTINDELSLIYPNPFNPSTNINYKIKDYSYVKLSVYDVLGNLIANLVDDYQGEGNYSVNFNSSSYNLSSGIYLYQIKINNLVETKKMVILK